MRMQQRHHLLSWLTLAMAVTGAAPAWAQAPAGAIGCSLQGVGPGGAGNVTLMRSSGDAALDADLAATLERLSGWFGFGAAPRFYFLDDTGAPNAYSSPDIYGGDEDFPPERSRFGTVVFGVNLIAMEIRETAQGAGLLPLTGILAHELGHTLQSQRGNGTPGVINELQADFLAGWAIRGLKRTVAPQIDEAKAFSSIYNKGDYAFNIQQHHGTKTERLAAFLAGFRVKDPNVNAAYAAARAYLQAHPPGTDDDDDDTPQQGRPPGPNQGPPPGSPPPPDNNNGLTFAANLGILYEHLPSQDGTFALRIARPPEPGSPAANGGLEAGDIIVAMDETPFRTDQDVLNHVDRTTVTLIDVRTNMRKEAVIEIH
jgi:hypothetical protein